MGVHAQAGLVVLVVVAAAGCSSAPPEGEGPLVHLTITASGEDDMRFVVGVFNYGDEPLALAFDCSDWNVSFAGPLGPAPLVGAECAVPESVAPGQSASRAWTWPMQRLHPSVGSYRDVLEVPVEGDYTFRARFQGPQGMEEETVTWHQAAVDRGAVAAAGPADYGWRLWAWNGSALLENRGAMPLPVAWDPCGVPLAGTDSLGRPLPTPTCGLGSETFHVQPGRALLAAVPGNGSVAHLTTPGGRASMHAVWNGTFEGRTWFTGAWYGITGQPQARLVDDRIVAQDPARPGVSLIASADPADPWFIVRNESPHVYHYFVGCGLPWNDPGACAQATSAWLPPGEDLVSTGTIANGTVSYAFHWGPGGDALRAAIG